MDGGSVGKKDAYGRLAGLQDAILEPLNAPLRDVAVRVSGVGRGSRVLDVGCGTGTQLERYLAAGCDVAGIDTSPAMLARARERLGPAADLRLADAQRIPFGDAKFDVVTATLVLHELSPLEREAVGKEMARVLTDSGRLLVVDFSPGPLRGLKGWGLRAFSVLAELTARHLQRSRTFLAEGGVPRLAEVLGMDVRHRKSVAGGNMAVYVLTRHGTG
ncbi:methyltransferase domain-containing protein [Intrasporangium sp. DVR]|uniref:class I SAM-dependent methyltransferase n=1 Tax=Intrasporangium sp. DVR TaxID=3127867 RepID=UPI00313A7567